MSLLADITRKWNYSVESPCAGRILYREGNREYTFPFYEQEGEVVLVGVPSFQRVHYFFGWHRHPREFSETTRARILPRLEAHLRERGMRVRVLENGNASFAFRPELFADRSQAGDLLEEAGYESFSDYGSIDLLHEEYGLEIGGIRSGTDARGILDILKRGFPHWHHAGICPQECHGEPGWHVSLSLFPPETSAADWQEDGWG